MLPEAYISWKDGWRRKGFPVSTAGEQREGNWRVKIGGNEYNLRELAGAFGDLGTLIPFLVGYITISKMEPVGVLLAFGLFKIVAGLYFRTPVPIQPMKAAGEAMKTVTLGLRREVLSYPDYTEGRRAIAFPGLRKTPTFGPDLSA